MASRTSNLKSLFTNSRTRTIIIFTSFFIAVGVVVGYMGLREQVLGGDSSARFVKAPPTIQSVPGSFDATKEYVRAQEEENKEKAKEALQTGTAFVPTLIKSERIGEDGAENVVGQNGFGFSNLAQAEQYKGALKSLNGLGQAGSDANGHNANGSGLDGAGGNGSGLNGAGANGSGLDGAGANGSGLDGAGANGSGLDGAGANGSGLNGTGGNGSGRNGSNQGGRHGEQFGDSGLDMDALSRIPVSAAVTGGADLEALKQKELTAANAQQSAQLQNILKQKMTNQANQLFQAWVSPTQVYVVGTQKDKAQSGSSERGGAVNGADANNPGPMVTIKAGDMQYAVLDTAVNTDEPGPILATLTSGRFKGGKLIGTVTTNPPPAQKVLFSFSKLNLPNADKTISITAVAIDPATSRTAFASYTNNHTLVRYGTLFASSFIAGFAKALTQSGSTITQNAQSGQTVTANQTLSTKQQVLIGLGNVGQQMGTQLAPIFGRLPTIFVRDGTAMGVLFLGDTQVPESFLEKKGKTLGDGYFK